MSRILYIEPKTAEFLDMSWQVSGHEIVTAPNIGQAIQRLDASENDSSRKIDAIIFGCPFLVNDSSIQEVAKFYLYATKEKDVPVVVYTETTAYTFYRLAHYINDLTLDHVLSSSYEQKDAFPEACKAVLRMVRQETRGTRSSLQKIFGLT